MTIVATCVGDLWARFCLARVYAVSNDAERCRFWLRRCTRYGYLEKCTDSQFAYFENVIREEWFVSLIRDEKLRQRVRALASEGFVDPEF